MSYSMQATALVAAAIGKNLLVSLLRDAALQGLESFDALIDESRRLICENQGVAMTTSLSQLQRLKAGGASTLMTYSIGMRKLIAKFEKTGDPDDLKAIQTATAGVLKGTQKESKRGAINGNTGAGAGTPSGAGIGQTAPALTLDDCIGFLQQAHDIGTLDGKHYAAMQQMVEVFEIRASANARPFVEPVSLTH